MPESKATKALPNMADADIAIVRIAPETSFKNKAYEALKEAILKMDIYSTAEPVMLDERALSERLGVSRGLDADHDAAGLGLVENVRGDDLHHDRETHGGRDLAGVGCRFRHTFFGNRNAIGVANQFAFRRGQAGTLVSLDGIKHFADGIFVGHLGLLLKHFCGGFFGM